MVPLDGLSSNKGFRDVNQSLVGGAAEGETEIPQAGHVFAINQNVGDGEEVFDGFVAGGHGEQLFEGVAAVGDDVEAEGADLAAEEGQGRGLEEGLAAGEGDAADVFGFFYAAEDLAAIDEVAAVKGVGGGVVAAGAVVLTALGEEDEADPGAVDDAFGDVAGKADFHCDTFFCILWMTRCLSSESLASLKRSTVLR